MAEEREGPDTKLVRPTLRGTAGAVGVGLAVVYAIGFVVSNVHFGALWLVDPSLLQARYASAGILWAAFLGASVVPVYYAIDFWRAGTQGTRDPGSQDDESEWPLGSSLLDQYRESAGLRRIWKAVLLVLLILAGLVATIVFVSPFWPFGLLLALGAHPVVAALPTAAFHFTILGLAFLVYWGGMTRSEHFDFRNNPHRAVVLVAALLVHAGAFGHFIYPIVPARSGGARPLPAQIIMDSEAVVPSSVDMLSGAGDRAYVVTSTNEYLVTMVPKSQENGDATVYCAVVLRHENVAAIIVQPDYSPFRPEASFQGRMRNPTIPPAPRIGDCR